MNVLMFSSDREIFNEQSAVRERMSEYGRYMATLHIIVFTRHTHGFSRAQIAENVWVYPTNSRSRWHCVFDAARTGRDIIGNWILDIGNSRENFIVTSQDPFEIGLAAWCVARRKKCALQLQIHTDIFSPCFARESLKNRIRVRIARFLLPRADCVRVVSERIKHSLIERHIVPESRIAVLPVFVDVQKIRSAPITVDVHKKYRQFDFVILMVSRLTREKNIGLALASLQTVVRTHPHTGLVIAGEGPERAILEADTIRRGLQHNVIFTGAVDFSTLISYYKTADLYLLTSNYEGYGRTLIEALAVGLPMVVTDVGIAREITQNRKHNIIVPIGDIISLTQRIITSLEKRRESGQTYQNLLMQFDNKSTHLKKYQEALSCCYGK